VARINLRELIDGNSNKGAALYSFAQDTGGDTNLSKDANCDLRADHSFAVNSGGKK